MVSNLRPIGEQIAEWFTFYSFISSQSCNAFIYTRHCTTSKAKHAMERVGVTALGMYWISGRIWYLAGYWLSGSNLVSSSWEKTTLVFFVFGTQPNLVSGHQLSSNIWYPVSSQYCYPVHPWWAPLLWPGHFIRQEWCCQGFLFHEKKPESKFLLQIWTFAATIKFQF